VTLQELEHLGVGFVSLTEALDFTTPPVEPWPGCWRYSPTLKERFCGNELERALANARQNGQRLGRPMTAGLQAAEIRKLHRTGVAKAEIARRLQIGRTSVRRILKGKASSK
jgi:DNA invertase Pin-like site-specific DNA recombinase